MAVSTAVSISGTEISKSSRMDAWDASSRSPMARGPAVDKGLDGGEHAVVFGDDVAHAAERLVVQNLSRPRQVGDGEVAQERHAHGARPTLARLASRRVSAVGVRVLDPGVEHHQRKPVGLKVKGDCGGAQGGAVKEDGVVFVTKERGDLVHDSGGGADRAVFRELARPWQASCGRVRAPTGH